jgi:hypothetical protein
MKDLKAALQRETQGAILAYNMNRAQLVQAASREGGAEAVAKLEDEFAALCKADFAMTRARLDANHRQYETLMSEAAAYGDLLRQSIIEMESFENILDELAKTVAFLGRILLMLAA